MIRLPVFVMDKDVGVGDWVRSQLAQIGVEAQWIATVSELLAAAEHQPPTVCLFALRPPVGQALSAITDLTQEPRFASTAFILMGPIHYKHAAFEAGADDYLITPPDVIELRKRVRLYLDRAELEARVVAETRITQEMERLSKPSQEPAIDEDSLTLLEHAAALTQERNLLDTVFRYAGQAIVYVDADGTVCYANPAWEKLIGQKHGWLIGDRIKWPPVAAAPSETLAIAHAVIERRSWQGEIRCMLPGGDFQDLAITINPAFDADDALTGFVITYLDVAERKAIEKTRSRFLSDAATEMRTPVTNLKMRHYLLQQAPSDQRDMHLQALAREIERLSRLVETMLELARLDAGLAQFVIEKMDPNRLISEVVTRFSSAAAEKGITLVGQGDESIPTIYADPIHIARALGLLIENAIQHTPEAGHIKIHLEHEGWSGGNYITLRVQDTGMGIEPEAIPFIFDRFYRSDRARDSIIQGVGLGLAIAQEIVIRHSGHIVVESRVNQGSTFTIWLPDRSPEQKSPRSV